MLTVELVNLSLIDDHRDICKGTVTFNDSNHEIYIRKKYDYERRKTNIDYEVRLDDITLESIEKLVKLDLREIYCEFERLLNKRKNQQEEERLIHLREDYDESPLHNVKKVLDSSTEGLKITITPLDQVMKSSISSLYIEIQDPEDKSPSYSVTYDSQKCQFCLRDRYSYKDVKRSKNFELVLKSLKERIEINRRKRESELLYQTRTKTMLQKFRDEVNESIVVRSTTSKHGTSDFFSFIKNDPNCQYKEVSMDMSQINDNGRVSIGNIKGKFTLSQIKRILDVVREGEMVY